MKRPLFAILALCVLTVGLVGCGGNDSEIPEGYSQDDVGNRPDAPVKSPSKGVGKFEKPND